MKDYRELEQGNHEERLAPWRQWLEKSEKFSQAVLSERQGRPLDVDALWEAAREERDSRDDRILGR